MKKIPLPDQLNICFIACTFPILGRTANHGFLWPIAKGLAKKNHNVTVLSWKNPRSQREIFQDGVKAYYLGEPYETNRNLFPELAKERFSELHKEQPFHIVHSIDSNGYLISQRKKHYRVAITYDIEATQMAQIFSILGMAQETLGSLLRTGIAVLYKFLRTYFGGDRKLLKSADGVFVTSPLQKIVLERYYLYPDYRTYAIPYGIEIGDLSPKEKSEELWAKMNLPGNARTIVCITDMTEMGDIQNLLFAFEKVAIKKNSARLIIVGNGPLKHDIEFQVLDLALGSRVIFTGAVSNQDLPDYISIADVFVNLSSRTSGFEPSILEAMGQKKVIIGSEVSPISTIVEEGKNGFLVRPADIKSLSTLLNQIFTDQLPIDHIGENARQKIVELFDMDKMVGETLKAYYETLKKTGYYKVGSGF